MAYSENKHDEFKSDLLFIACIMYLVTDGKNKGPWMWWFFPTIVQSQAVGPFMRYLKQYNGSFPQQKPAKGEWLSDQIWALRACKSCDCFPWPGLPTSFPRGFILLCQPFGSPLTFLDFSIHSFSVLLVFYFPILFICRVPERVLDVRK